MNMVIEALLAALVVVLMLSLWKRKARPKVWIIDDSESDIMLYKTQFRLDEYDVRYFQSVEQIALKMRYFEKPAVILVDYMLKDNVDGDQVMRFCERNCIPSLLITGYDGDITGIDKSRIRIKTNEPSFYRDIEAYIHSVTSNLI